MNEMPALHRLRQNERRRFMVNFPSGYLESKLYARALQRWADTARKAATVDLATLASVETAFSLVQKKVAELMCANLVIVRLDETQALGIGVALATEILI